jgi:hypothetical protein
MCRCRIKGGQILDWMEAFLRDEAYQGDDDVVSQPLCHDLRRSLNLIL